MTGQGHPRETGGEEITESLERGEAEGSGREETARTEMERDLAGETWAENREMDGTKTFIGGEVVGTEIDLDLQPGQEEVQTSEGDQ